MKNKITIYLIGWTGYISFSLLLFPALDVTVLEGSIPLAMLGGWLFLYHGAWSTVLMTIPYHYLLLSIHTDPAVTIQQSFNPFGISTQILLSFSAAFLNQQKTRYALMNNSLENIINQRTSELSSLTDYLLRLQQEEKSNICNLLLSKPLATLKEMISLNDEVRLELKNTPLDSMNETSTIQKAIQRCIISLENADNFVAGQPYRAADNYEALSLLKHDYLNNSNIDIKINFSELWENFETNTFTFIYEIITEAVTNAVRHAEAKHIEIGIKQTDAGITVFIENDGKPLPGDFIEGMGLPLMRYRAAKIGAKLSIGRCENSNTRMECILPAR